MDAVHILTDGEGRGLWVVAVNEELVVVAQHSSAQTQVTEEKYQVLWGPGPLLAEPSHPGRKKLRVSSSLLFTGMHIPCPILCEDCNDQECSL